MKLVPNEPDVQTLVRRIEEGDIDLQPDFQRQEVWSRTKKRKLIDTILRDWSIPPIHLVRTIDGQLEVLDGQQRLTAVRDFLANDFSVDGGIEPIDDTIRGLHGKFFKDLPIDARRRVQNFSIKCFTLTDYRPDEPSELFYRLNEPTMLTAGERRNALYGEARDQLKSLVRSMALNGLGKATLGFTNSRLSYDDVIARLLIFLEHGDISEKSTESRVSERFRRGDRFSDDIFERVEDTLKSFSLMKQTAADIRLNKASLLSWLLFVSREPSGEKLGDFFRTFYHTNVRGRGIYYVDEAKDVFEDRSRLRVADVTSVLFRDFALWYVFRFTIDSPLPKSVDVDIINMVHDDVHQRDDVTFEYALQQRVTSSTWGSIR